MHVWVTGANGQIGRRVCRRLLAEGHTITGLGRNDMQPSLANYWIDWDMSKESVNTRNAQAPDAVLHLAAQTSAYQARKDPLSDVKSNVVGFVSLLETIREIGSKPHVILVGAATETGFTFGGKITDADRDNPETFYDVGKVAQRLYLNQYHDEGWLYGTTIRLPNVYGGVSSDLQTDRGFINRSINEALLGHDLFYYSDSDYTRDFLYIDDAVSALLETIKQGRNLSGETFLVGTGQGTRIRDVLKEIARQAELITNTPIHVKPALPPSDMYSIERRNAIVDSERFQIRTGWSPQICLVEGIRRMVLELI